MQLSLLHENVKTKESTYFCLSSTRVLWSEHKFITVSDTGFHTKRERKKKKQKQTLSSTTRIIAANENKSDKQMLQIS